MFNVYLESFLLLALLAFLLWLISLVKKDVSIVDPCWSLFFLLAINYFNFRLAGELVNTRILVLSILVTIWALRLSGYLFWRNWGQGEDYRYARMRTKGGETFWWKSLFKVFLLQATLAWLISSTLFSSYVHSSTWNALDYLACAVWLIGFVFEAGGDWQLARFKSKPENRGELLISGLWKLTRHPNYFGDAACWWGYALFGLAAGNWWAPLGAILMTYLLLKVSGVAMLEPDMAKKKGGYEDYRKNTPAFFPRVW